MQGEESDALYKRVLEDIASGYFAGGQRLKVQELAARYATSTNPVREVLRLLQGEGFVEFAPNRGATVRQADASAIRDIFEILQVIEPYFVGWFAEFCTPEQVDSLRRIQAKIENAQDDEPQVYSHLDTEFHSIICTYHYNARAVALWQNQRAALRAFTARLPLSRTRRKAINVEHHELIRAFEDSDPEQASAIIRRHIEGSGQQMYEQIRILEAQKAI